jgi:hypothetical protein
MLTYLRRSTLTKNTAASGALIVALSGCAFSPDFSPRTPNADQSQSVGPEPCTATPIIASPVNCDTLKGSVQTFTWTPGAAAYWLTVGSAPGLSDIYASGPLGGVTNHTVAGLPLNGAPLFVGLRAQCASGGFAESNAEYFAAVRKGLAIIVDFADVRLEDWVEPLDSPVPPGFHSEDDIREVLQQMTGHWEWLSRGAERVIWGLTRVQLPRELVENAYASDAEFRRAVIDLADVSAEDYDQDGDGMLEGMWMIVSAQDRQAGDPGFAFLSAGGAQVDNVKSFVDGQGSYAVRYRRYGAFNHEFARAAALPELYGRFSTVNAMTLMASGVEHLPGDDLSAFDREQFGWLRPVEVGPGVQRLALPSADVALAALKIPTARSYEYFLIEYRKTPVSGFGSLAPAYDGLAVYHAFTPATQNQDPPKLKLEAAGEPVLAGGDAEPEDLFYPENHAMELPRVLRSYVTNEPIFQINGVTRTSDGMAVDLEVLAAAGSPELPNLAADGSFEQGVEDPTLWSPANHRAEHEWSSVARTGTRSVSVSAQIPIDAEWRQQIDGLTAEQSYLLCGFIKGENIVRHQAKRAGGTIALSDSFEQAGPTAETFDWTERCLAFQTDQASVDVACRLGGFGSLAEGTLWCDDFSLVPLYRSF